MDQTTACVLHRATRSGNRRLPSGQVKVGDLPEATGARLLRTCRAVGFDCLVVREYVLDVGFSLRMRLETLFSRVLSASPRHAGSVPNPLR